MNLYAYCLSNQPINNAIERAAGVANTLVRLIEVEGIRAIISEIGAERVTLTRENVLTHEAVIRRVLSQTTPLPFRFGTIVARSQLEDYIRANRMRIITALDRVRDAVEMNVKILSNLDAQKISADEATHHTMQDEYEKPGPGAAFLLAKRREIAIDEARAAEAEEIAAWLAESVGDAARETIIQVRPRGSIIVDAAHLVERARLTDYRERIARARNERGELRLLASGAWPPYSFCDLK
ncbi:MAG TPA: GvpL/GvpF family gas vesicle protein [Blastocatellia bacterium]|jgi:hypothetical protein|nr:GvpL/GvpF family gas vesicle protein [Blastocatellia bacterium]